MAVKRRGKTLDRFEQHFKGGLVDVIDRYTKQPAIVDGRPCTGLSEADADAILARLDTSETDRRATAWADNAAIDSRR